MTTALPPELRDVIEAGALAHLSTVNPDGSPQVTMIWIGFDGDTLISAHMRDNKKLHNIRREPRVALSFTVPAPPGEWLHPYAVIRATATVEPSDQVGVLMGKMAKAYVGPDSEFPESQGGFVVRYSIDRIGGIGPWAS